jgi:hypothetical protein
LSLSFLLEELPRVIAKKTTGVLTVAEMALKEAAAEAISEHKRIGRPIVVWRDGRVVKIPPEETVASLSRPPDEDGSDYGKNETQARGGRHHTRHGQLGPVVEIGEKAGCGGS